MTGVEGPDFICIGLPKAGTGWLYDQLEAHPGFWMPPVKELVYLNQENPRLKFVDDKGEAVPRLAERERLVHRTNLDERDKGFLRYAATCRDQPSNLERYAKLFQFKGALMSGDITPPYWALSPEIIAEVAARFPQTKIVLLLRDPVERAWSRISMAYRAGNFDAEMLDSTKRFRRYVAKTPKLGTLAATEVRVRWQEHAPRLGFGVFFFDTIAADPGLARSEILTFLGADPDEKSGTLSAGFNRKADSQKLDMTKTAREVLVDFFAEELRASADLFGGPATNWVVRYGL